MIFYLVLFGGFFTLTFILWRFINLANASKRRIIDAHFGAETGFAGSGAYRISANPLDECDRLIQKLTKPLTANEGDEAKETLLKPSKPVKLDGDRWFDVANVEKIWNARTTNLNGNWVHPPVPDTKFQLLKTRKGTWIEKIGSSYWIQSEKNALIWFEKYGHHEEVLARGGYAPEKEV